MLALIFWTVWIADYLLTSRSQHDNARWRAEHALAAHGPDAFAYLSGKLNAAQRSGSRREARLAIGYLIRCEAAARRDAGTSPAGRTAARHVAGGSHVIHLPLWKQSGAIWPRRTDRRHDANDALPS